jgi:hypothetical protein
MIRNGKTVYTDCSSLNSILETMQAGFELITILRNSEKLPKALGRI